MGAVAKSVHWRTIILNAYTIAIKLSLIDGATSALAGIATRFGSLHRQQLAATNSLAAYETQLRRIKTLGLIGGASLGAGLAGIDTLKGPLEEAAKFQTLVTKLQATGIGERATADAVRFAKSMDIMGQSARDNVRLITDAITLVGDLEHAKAVTPILAKMRFGFEAVMGEGKSGDFETSLQAALKVGELRGALVNKETGQIDVPRFTGALNMMAQSYVASGGRVKPEDYLAAMKTGGVSTKMMNDEMFFFGLGHFMQESGGSRTGTAAMSTFQNWEMGQMPQGVAERMRKLGLLNESAIHYGKTGHVTSVDAAGIVDAMGFAANPFKWVNEQVVPRLKAQGLEGDQLNLALASYLGIRTAKNQVDQFVRDEKIATLYIDRAKKAANIDTLYSLAGGTERGKEIDLQAKWNSLLNELGTTILPLATKALEKFTDKLKMLTDLAERHPTLTKLAVGGLLAVSALGALGGALLLARESFGALGLVMGFPAIGGAAGIAKMAGSISLLGVSLATAMKYLGGVGLAAGAGAAAGTAIYDATAESRFMNGFGRGLNKAASWFNIGDSREAEGQVNRWAEYTKAHPFGTAAAAALLSPEMQSRVAAFVAPLSMKYAPAAPQSTPVAGLANQFASPYVRTAQAPTMVQVQSRISIDGRAIAQAVDDHINRATASGAGMGTTQFDPTFSVPPLALPGGAK